MKIIRYTLLADGSSDEVLIPIIDWLISQYLPNSAILATFAKDIGKVGLDLESRIPAALRNFPCDLFFVHRDGEGQGLEMRRTEICKAAERAGIHHLVPIVPVRMTEAWLLSDESAIRSAAGKSAGKVDLKLPPKKSWESLPDPKVVLFEALTKASERSGRALKKFNPAKERALVALRTRDFGALRGLPSFDLFEVTLVQQLERLKQNALD